MTVLTASIAKSADSTAFDPTKIAVSATSAGSGVPVGTIIAWNSYAMPDNGEWLECNGQSVPADAVEYRAKFGAYTPDYQGMFLRGYGEQSFSQVNGTTTNKGLPTETKHLSGNIGEVQGDAIRNITGTMGGSFELPSYMWTTGTFYSFGNRYVGQNGDDRDNVAIGIDASRVVPTAVENRPVNKAVKYIIKVK